LLHTEDSALTALKYQINKLGNLLPIFTSTEMQNKANVTN